ncbi:MAG: NUDIX domain-containing protein [Dermabacter sp.]|nr:NUDIX domain-containing protein [Dermabacter sp.]
MTALPDAPTFALELRSAADHDGLRERFLERSTDPAFFLKADTPEHFTASGIVVDASGTFVALHFHRKVGAWLQFGGHLEPGERSFEQAALREVREESGLADLTRMGPGPVVLHPRALGSGFAVCREHWDVQYLFRASLTPRHATDGLRLSSESSDLAWFPLDALPGDLIADLRPTLAGPVRALLA